MGAQRFKATLEQHGSGTVVVVPFDLREAFGSGRPPVRATVNGHTFRTSLFTMGGRALLGLNRGVREAARVEGGERVTVEVELDDEPRTVEVPDDLRAALEPEPELRAFFDSLSYTHRKEYVRWIEGAKRDETRSRRIAKAVEMLCEGVRTPD
jgi:hypothetical protein